MTQQIAHPTIARRPRILLRTDLLPPIKLHVGPMRTTDNAAVFTAYVGERPLGEFRQPYYDCARALLAKGSNPATRLEMYSDGVLCLSGLTVGAAAKLTVQEDREGNIRTVRYVPHPRTVERAAAKAADEAG